MSLRKVALNLLYVVPNKVGGTQTYAEGILAECNKNATNTNFHVFCSSEYAAKVSKIAPNLQVHAIPLIGASRILRILFENLLLPWMVLFLKINVVHSLGYTCPIWVPCKNIVTIHDLNWHFHPEDFSFFEKKIWQLLVTLSAKTSHIIITDSQASKKAITDVLTIPESKVVTIYPGVPELPSLSSITTVDAQSTTTLKPYLLTVSSLVPHKNIQRLIKAFALVQQEQQELKLVVVGLSGKDAEEVKHLIEHLGVKDKVMFTGWVSQAKLTALYAHSTAFVFVSLYEGFGFPALEAFFYKTPLISSPSFSLQEIIGSAAEIIDPYSIESISAGISNVIKSTQRQQHLRKLGEKRLPLFTWKKSYTQLMHIYG